MNTTAQHNAATAEELSATYQKIREHTAQSARTVQHLDARTHALDATTVAMGERIQTVHNTMDFFKIKMQKTVLSHTPERLLIGVGFRRRFLLLGFGMSLAGLACLGLAMLHGGLNSALFGPLLGALALTGLLGIYRAFRADNNVYERHSGAFLRYEGNLLSGKRVQLRHKLRNFTRLEYVITEPGNAPKIFLRGLEEETPLEISDYEHATVRVLSGFLGLPMEQTEYDASTHS